MYICKFETERNIKQMELTDYFGTEREIVFDMNNPKDIKKAMKHLTPKGLRKVKRHKSETESAGTEPFSALDQYAQT